ncbi:transposase [Rickettsia endosymbiont of Urophora cardui]|uniref:transposase n=1 Tax=Rickettsia endosymbiont of Urophora cardui TaxID=3066265 RepID=UPI00397CE09D
MIAVKITKANRADLSVLESITQKITGKVFGDKAYICKELWFKLYSRNLRMITNIRKDMKNYLVYPPKTLQILIICNGIEF